MPLLTINFTCADLCRHKDAGRALLRWLYTNEIYFKSKWITVKLLKNSHKYQLHALFELCELALIKELNISTCAEMHEIATDFESTKMLKLCKPIASAYWDNLMSQDIDELSEVVLDFDNRTPLPQKGTMTVCIFLS